MQRILVDSSYGALAPRVGSEARAVDARSFDKNPRIVLTIPQQRGEGMPEAMEFVFDIATARRLRRLIGFAIEDAKELVR